ncbi:hypothetical protein AVEN_44075-1 [Araneus ventricosus]|uniref:Uncharacterized protein n=1 Tax=Araneus ventricosus TaxID=182803 RepID=A0A4Y2QPU6_ARAVE|nr:hypothetical protein AVEN_224024-1 [Araneus ventricosus]GBN65288.1 hypothetical protein AVEN_44075-1 [Araneus ventricosus]
MKTLVYQTPVYSVEDVIARISVAAGRCETYQESSRTDSLIRASTGNGDPELPSARGYILASELSQSSTFGSPAFDNRICHFSPSITDSRSSIQHLANWHRGRDNMGMNILNKLRSLSVSYRIHMQWIPCHVNIQGNENADALAKAGADDVQYLLLLSHTWSCSLEIKAGIKLSGSFHRCIIGIKVLDQVSVYQLTATDATRQLLLASLVGISDV